jgi:hypothetical protein
MLLRIVFNPAMEAVVVPAQCNQHSFLAAIFHWYGNIISRARWIFNLIRELALSARQAQKRVSALFSKLFAIAAILKRATAR